MRSDQFAALCRSTATVLGVDPAEFESGAAVDVKGAQTWMLFQEATSDAYAMYEVGAPRAGLEAEVHRQLLELHWLFVGRFDAVFMLASDELAFSVRTPMHDGVTGEQFAQWITMMAEQVLLWRSTVLAGKMIDASPPELDAIGPSVSQLA